MSILLALPILIPLTTAAACLLAWRWRLAQRTLSLAGAFALCAAGILLLYATERREVLVVQIGGWPAPFGITLVADLFAAAMVAVAGLVAASAGLYATVAVDRRRQAFGFHPLLHVMLMGICGSFLTGDIFNLYVWFEVMLIASFVLMALGGERGQVEGAIKYVALNLVASAILLAAVGLLHGITGTLNMADLAVKLRAWSGSGHLTALSVLLLVAFGIKAAVFPLFFWLPASYHTPPVAISAIFAGLLTKVGVYALIRVFTLIFVQDVAFSHTLILALAGLTMMTGVLGAVTQEDFRRILSFHIISQIGYMIMGLGLFTLLGLAASLYYIVHHIIVKTNLFLVSGLAARFGGTFEIRKLGGLYVSRPLLAILFLIPAFSLAGIPPLSGFFAKLALLKAGAEVGSYLIVGIALIVSLLTLFSMSKIWAEAFWKPALEQPLEASAPHRTSFFETAAWWGPSLCLAALTCAMGLAAGPALDLSLRAAGQLLDPTAYISAVLGARQ